MHVLQVTNTLHKGGTEAHLLELTKGLKGLGVTCEVAFLRSAVTGGSTDLREVFEAEGIRTHYLACEGPYDLRAPVRLRRLLASRHWDVLHSHLPRPDAAAAMCRLLDPYQTWIATLHHPYDSDDDAYAGRRWIPAVAPMWRLADGVIAVSESLRQWAITRWGLSPASVHTVPHGIDVGAQVASTAGTGEPRHTIGAIGRYERRKGHDTLIRAMVTVLKFFPDARLHLAGHDPWGYGAVLQGLIDELGLQQHVQLVGYVSDKDAFFAGIDVFALASRSEGFGIVLLEAMAAAKPVVVSDIAPLNEIVQADRSGLVADAEHAEGFAEAIMSLFRDPARLDAIGREGRCRVQNEFSQAKMVARTHEYYQTVLRRRGEMAR
jgi:glycosyltransferase involved in cell wall biosynthesis